MKQQKTEWKYGEKSELALRLARTKKQITHRDFAGMDRQLANHMLNGLVIRGKLKKVKSGGIGRYGDPAVYVIGGGE